MKKLIICKILLLSLFQKSFTQEKISGYIFDEITNDPVENVTVFDNYSDGVVFSNKNGFFEFVKNKRTIEISFYKEGYNLFSLTDSIKPKNNIISRFISISAMGK